jgi:hypothetical protein
LFLFLKKSIGDTTDEEEEDQDPEDDEAQGGGGREEEAEGKVEDGNEEAGQARAEFDASKEQILKSQCPSTFTIEKSRY